MMKYKKTVFNIFVVVLILLATSTLWSGEPGELVREVILKDTSLKPEEMTKELKWKIWDEMSFAFDFEEMTKNILGNHWKKRSNEEKREFIDIFTRYLRRAYARKSSHRFGEKIISLKEKQDNDSARVQVKLIKRTEGEALVDFFLHRKSGKWQIYDAVIEGVSITKNYRQQIQSFLTESSYEDLVKKLK
ncbi:MAG: ABC transporter substrate-binding protein [Candidatus Brocadiaceae bacterium]|nr:ABC transporter substrate-binding protein [Candidatus Brocadiaceae bacterium]